MECEGEDGWRARGDGVNSCGRMIGALLRQKVHKRGIEPVATVIGKKI